jgi:hypothetical protein
MTHPAGCPVVRDEREAVALLREAEEGDHA